jgi:hypothetical protein
MRMNIYNSTYQLMKREFKMKAIAKTSTDKEISVNKTQAFVGRHINSPDAKPRSKDTCTDWLFLKGISSTSRDNILQYMTKLIAKCTTHICMQIKV